MNLILLPESAPTASSTIPGGSPLAEHLSDVLKVQPGDLLETGIWMGPRARSTVIAVGPEAIRLEHVWPHDLPHTPLFPVTLVIGCPRPVQARRILREATSLGVSRLLFVTTDKSEPSYAQSKLWHENEWLPLLQEGACQAMTCHGPEVIPPHPLRQFLESPTPDTNTLRIHCDLYQDSTTMAHLLAQHPSPNAIELLIGPERGWSPREREWFQELGIPSVHLGPRVLRTETACTVALAQALPAFSPYQPHVNPR